MSSSIVPKDLRRLRACIRCHLIKTVDQFVADGCENCRSMSHGSHDQVMEETTDRYAGFVSLMDANPSTSWVARYFAGTFPLAGEQRRKAGVYAMKVYEELENDLGAAAASDDAVDAQVEDDLDDEEPFSPTANETAAESDESAATSEHPSDHSDGHSEGESNK